MINPSISCDNFIAGQGSTLLKKNEWMKKWTTLTTGKKEKSLGDSNKGKELLLAELLWPSCKFVLFCGSQTWSYNIFKTIF